MNQTELKKTRQKRRRQSVRRRLSASGPSQRLSVHRTSKHIYAQIVDDATGRTLCGVASTAAKLSGELDGKTKTERATVIGREIAKLAKESGVETVVFDRGHCKYHGRVKALADAAREEGLKF